MEVAGISVVNRISGLSEGQRPCLVGINRCEQSLQHFGTLEVEEVLTGRNQSALKR